MFKKTMKKMMAGALAVTCVFGCVGTFAACDDGNPEAKIVMEFNGEEYVLNYQLYKDKTPATVNHFIWLVENEYYDGMCIHNYQDANNRWYTGAYTTDENGNLDYEDYDTFVRSSSNFKSFPQTVWADEEQETPMLSVYGEFSDNSFKVGANDSDVLKQQYGSLSMYYHAKDTDRQVWVKNTKGEIIKRGYSANSATSMFYISTISGKQTNTAHCTFATLNNTSVLEDLQAAIAEYIEDQGEDYSFVTQRSEEQHDSMVGNYSVSYDVPNEPIIIKEVRITKY